MNPLSLAERTALAGKILAGKQRVAEAVTEEFLSRHPDWLARYGERGRKHGVEDAAFHQSYLASAIEAGSPAPFSDYARWVVEVLNARNIASHFVSENFQQIAQALRLRLSTAESLLVDSYIEQACAACQEPASPASAEKAEPSAGLARSRRIYVQAAIRGDRRAATNIALHAMSQVTDIADLYVDFFQAAQYEVGRLWQDNQITVADEHMATAITQYALAQVYSKLELLRPERGRMVITGVEGEMHQLGANMVADVFESRGWSVLFLGANVPQDAILKAVEEHRADAIAISATMLPSLPNAVRLVQALRERFAARCPRILLGGRAFASAPELVKELGAEGGAADLRSVLSII